MDRVQSADGAEEAASQAFSRRSLEIGESPGQFATLTIIARNPGISQTELSHANGRDKSSLTPVVDLVRRGLVERKRVDSDRRAYRPNLTTDGKKALTQLTRCARRHERSLDRIIGLRDRRAVPGAAQAHRGGDRVKFNHRRREFCLSSPGLSRLRAEACFDRPLFVTLRRAKAR